MDHVKGYSSGPVLRPLSISVSCAVGFGGSAGLFEGCSTDHRSGHLDAKGFPVDHCYGPCLFWRGMLLEGSQEFRTGHVVVRVARF